MNNQQRAENAIKWIETLLKTRMKQGTGHLGDDQGGYCCLGVACKALELDYDPERGWLTEEHKDLVGLLDSEGEAKSRATRKTLSVLNDNEGWTFKQIGKLVASEPDEYFHAEVAKLIKKHFQES